MEIWTEIPEGDIALLKKPDGRVMMGLGPFSAQAECPKSGWAFYVNDFALTDATPWKIPHQVVELDVSALKKTTCELEWDDLTPEPFAAVFSAINEAIKRGEIEKSVPVATERGKLKAGVGRQLMGALGAAHKAFFPYGYTVGDVGFCGLTPELLFHLRKGRLKTMALAGTARADERDVFGYDEKEIREHEYVANTLVAGMSDIGMVKRSERRVMDLGALVHFHTPIEVFMYGDYPVEFLVKKLHPTPALGPHPRTEVTMKALCDWRELMGCPPMFGAPFGLYDHGEFHAVVLIRGVHWDGSRVAVPSGCGVIEASRLVNEWRELSLKRASVKTLFGLA